MFDEWHGLYAEGWGDSIVPEAFSHPAKFRPALIRHIYDHMLAEGWLKAGDVVLDPFAGVALGALHAMRRGLYWIGVELEAKFVALGQANIELWNERYSPLWPIWGGARIIQGDSRKLLLVLAEDVMGLVSSPPYSEGCQHTGGDDLHPEHIEGGKRGITIGYSAAVSSPPFEDAVGSDDPEKRGGLYHDPKRSGDRNLTATYGDTPGQLGAMKGGFEAAVSSPPYNLPMSQDHSGRGGGERGTTPSEKGAFAVYGSTPGQLEGLPPGDVQAAVSSPPFGTAETRDRTPYQGGYVGDMMSRAYTQDRQGEAEGQVGAMHAETFWQAARTIIEQVYAALAPGGHAVWVTKAFVRDKKRVDFPGQWRQLCEAVGFRTVHEHHAMLVEDSGTQLGFFEDERLVKERKSFFRRLAESKGSPRIDYEVVWCMEKPPYPEE